MEKFTWEDAKYPCLGISINGEIVCFSSYGEGHTVDKIENYYSKTWKMKDFAPYVKSEITTMENKVYQYMIDNKLNRLYLDEWLPNELYKFANKIGTNIDRYKGIEFMSITKPSGGAGMGASPASVTICMLKDISK